MSVTEESPMGFFAENVDAWGAAEWFDRLAKAIEKQDTAVVAGDDIAFETYRNIAASSAMRLVRDFAQPIRAALEAASLPKEEGVPVEKVLSQRIEFLERELADARATADDFCKENVRLTDALIAERFTQPEPPLPEGEWKIETQNALSLSGYHYATGPGDLRIQTNDKRLLDRILAALASPAPVPSETVEPRPLVDELTGALRFIMAFYEPGQNYLDTNAWKVAEAGGRRALAKGEAYLSEQGISSALRSGGAL